MVIFKTPASKELVIFFCDNDSSVKALPDVGLEFRVSWGRLHPGGSVLSNQRAGEEVRVELGCLTLVFNATQDSALQVGKHFAHIQDGSGCRLQLA